MFKAVKHLDMNLGIVLFKIQLQPNTEFFVPNMGDNLNINRQTNITERLAPNRGNNLGTQTQFPKAPNVGGKSVLNIPNVGENPVMSIPNVGEIPVMSIPNVGENPVLIHS